MKNIVLIGMMGSGKTTCGTILSQKLGRKLVDADITIQKREGRTTTEIFAVDGEGYYRDLETALCHELEDQSDLIIATGGGTPCHADNMAWINAHGVSIHLDVSLPCLLQRAAHSRHVRPLLAEMSDEERESHIRRQLAERLPVYAQAHHRLEADNPDIQALAQRLAAVAQNVTKT